MAAVLHVLNGLQIGGKERVVLDLASRARRDDHDVHLLLFDTPFRNTDIDFDPADLPVHFLRRRPGLDWRYPARLAKLLRHQQIDIVHAHNDTAVFYACTAARLTKPSPLVLGTFHTWPGHDTRGARLLTRWAARRADRLTAVSDELADRLVERGWLPRCEVLWNGVDLDRFSPDGSTGDLRRKLRVPDSAILVGHLGRLDPIKRHVDLVAAAQRLADSEAHFVVVGQGPMHPTLAELSRHLGNVHLLPRADDVAAFLRELDLFVLCSDHEAAPKVLLEAMACATPVLATAVGGIPHILGDQGGRMLPARRPDQLAAAILELARDPQRRRQLGQQAHQRAQAFSAEQEWHRYQEIYATCRTKPAPITVD